MDIPPTEYNSETGERIIAFSDSDKDDSVSNVDDSDQILPQLNYIRSNVIIDEQDIQDILSISPVNKALGPDAISHKMLIYITFCSKTR